MIEFRVSDLARAIGVHRNTIRNWINNRILPARPTVGKKYVIKREDFLQFCKKRGLPEMVVEQFAPREMLSVAPQPVAFREGSEARSRVREIRNRESTLRATPDLGDVCLTCGSCSSACPISGVDGLDPRKIIRLVTLGMTDRVIESDWPWKCTLCGKCEEACPMNVEIVELMLKIRALRERDRVPGALHRGVLMALRRGNNLGIPREDFVELLTQLGEELAEEECPGFRTPIDVKGANIMVTVNSKEPFGEPDNMKFWWKIFYTAGESWTIPSENWEGVNWALFTGDDEAMKVIVGRIVDNMYRLKCKTLLLPE